MSPQSHLYEQDLSRKDLSLQNFGLIETLLWSKQQGFTLLEHHVTRLTNSAQNLNFELNIDEFDSALARAVKDLPTGQYFRVRAVLQRDGAIHVTQTQISEVPSSAVWQVAMAQTRFDSRWPLLRHKTTRRSLYEDEFADAGKRGADEVLFMNERGELCEGARCNIFVKRRGVLLTPTLECGLLPGTLRARLLQTGQAQVTILAPADLIDAEWYMGNSVRGLVRATMI